MKSLTVSEKTELQRLEAIVERGYQTFIEVAEAMVQIKDLCGMTSDEFVIYCQHRFGFGQRRMQQIAKGLKVANSVRTIVRLDNEAQAREAAKIPEQIRGPAIAAITSDGKPLTAARIKELKDDLFAGNSLGDMQDIIKLSGEEVMEVVKKKRTAENKQPDYRSACEAVIGTLKRAIKLAQNMPNPDEMIRGIDALVLKAEKQKEYL